MMLLSRWISLLQNHSEMTDISAISVTPTAVIVVIGSSECTIALLSK